MKNQARARSVLLTAMLLLAADAVLSQTSKTLLRTGADEEYLAFKRTFQKMVDEGDLDVAILRDDEGGVDLRDCTSGDFYLGPEGNASGQTRQRANLAYEVVRLKRLIARLGYPESVWRPALLALEEEGREEFDVYQGGHLERLSETLNAYRRRSAPALPKTSVVGGCGEGEVGVRIATRPRNGRVRLIPVFFYKLCQIQKIDPDDPRRCDHWRESAEGALLDLSGDYIYQASWSDGTRHSAVAPARD